MDLRVHTMKLFGAYLVGLFAVSCDITKAGQVSEQSIYFKFLCVFLKDLNTL